MVLDALAIVIAGVALAVSIASAVASYIVATRQSENQKRQNELQARLLALESSREQRRIRQGKSAAVRAEVARMGRDVCLRLSNDGSATARSMNVELDGRPMAEHAWMLSNDEFVSMLGPQAETSNIIALVQQSPSKAHIRITWDDDSGEPGEWESELKV